MKVTKLLRERRKQEIKQRRPVQRRPVQRQLPHPPKSSGGVGTTITQWLAKFGITSHQGCHCKALAREMDRVGPDFIEQNFEAFVNKMVESVKQWRKGKILVPPIPRIAIETIIRWAITKARKQEMEDPQIEL